MAGTILYVDDVSALPEGFAGEVSRIGYRLTHTADPEAAVRLAREGLPRIVLLEVLLGSGAGWELLEEIRSWGGAAGEVSVIVFTRGERTPELYARAVELGANDFLSKPVLRAELLAAVLECAEREGAASGVDAADADEVPADAALSGDLADSPLPELLLRLLRTGATGALLVQHEGETRGIQLRNGSPVAVASNRGVEPLEDFLVRTKRISGDEHEAATEGALAGRNAGEVLLEMGVLTERELEAAILERDAEPLLEGFGWSSGSHRFQPGMRLKSSRGLDFAQSPGRLLVEGALQWSSPMLVRKLLDRRAGHYVSRAEEPPYPLHELGPLAPEPELLEGLTGDHTVAEVLHAGALDERVLYALLVAGIVEVHPDPVLVLRQEVALERSEVEAAETAAPLEAREPASEPSEVDVLRAALANLAHRLAPQDDFGVLGVAEDPSDEEVREAYERMLAAVPLEQLPAEDQPLVDLAGRLRDRIEEAYAHLGDADSRRAFAALHRESESSREAEEQASRALEAESWFRKGEALLESRRYDGAIEAFGMAAHLDPKEGEYAAHLGYALHLAQPHDELVMREALEHIARGIKQTPDRWKPLVYLGRVFVAAGERENARKVLRRALKVQPDCHAALLELRLLDQRTEGRVGLLVRVGGWLRGLGSR